VRGGQIVALASEGWSDAQTEEFVRTGSADAALDLSPGPGARPLRFRVNVFRQQRGVAAAVRPVRSEVPALAQLGLPDEFKSLVQYSSGLVLMTGPTGSGKSTTLSSLLEHVNLTAARHVITLEDPIEFLYTSKRALIHQREVGRDVESFASGLRAALREDPDVILLGEMRDQDTIAAALTAAETGHLVLSTLHSGSAAMAIDRIIDVFPGPKQPQVRLQLAATLRAVVTQVLVPTTRGHDRVPAFEKMVVTAAVAAQIREGRAHQIATADPDRTRRRDGVARPVADGAASAAGGSRSTRPWRSPRTRRRCAGRCAGDCREFALEVDCAARGARHPQVAWLPGVAIAALAVVHMRAWVFVCDDAFISFRYARNLVEHGTLAFNIVEPPELVEGYTNFLWVVVLAIGAWLGAAPEQLAPWLTQVRRSSGCGWFACWCAARRGVDGDVVGAGAAAGAAPEFVVWGQGGLETRLRRCWSRGDGGGGGGRWRTAGVLTALAGLTRPDALVPVGLFVATWLIVHGRKDWPGWRALLQAGALAAGPLVIAPAVAARVLRGVVAEHVVYQAVRGVAAGDVGGVVRRGLGARGRGVGAGAGAAVGARAARGAAGAAARDGRVCVGGRRGLHGVLAVLGGRDGAAGGAARLVAG
jgi:pilus retraction protein PilT